MEKTADVFLTYFTEVLSLPVMTRSIKWMLEGIPRMVIDKEMRLILSDSSPKRENEALKFYQTCDEDHLNHFATTPETAPILYGMLGRVKKNHATCVKMGDISYSRSIVIWRLHQTIERQPHQYNGNLQDVLIKATNRTTR